MSDQASAAVGCGHSVWADSAYQSEAREEQLREQGYKSCIYRKERQPSCPEPAGAGGQPSTFEDSRPCRACLW